MDNNAKTVILSVDTTTKFIKLNLSGPGAVGVIKILSIQMLPGNKVQLTYGPAN